jgi:hypothetical protein
MAGYGQDGIDRIGAGCRLLQKHLENSERVGIVAWER